MSKTKDTKEPAEKPEDGVDEEADETPEADDAGAEHDEGHDGEGHDDPGHDDPGHDDPGHDDHGVAVEPDNPPTSSLMVWVVSLVVLVSGLVIAVIELFGVWAAEETLEKGAGVETSAYATMAARNATYVEAIDDGLAALLARPGLLEGIDAPGDGQMPLLETPPSETPPSETPPAEDQPTEEPPPTGETAPEGTGSAPPVEVTEAEGTGEAAPTEAVVVAEAEGTGVSPELEGSLADVAEAVGTGQGTGARPAEEADPDAPGSGEGAGP